MNALCNFCSQNPHFLEISRLGRFYAPLLIGFKSRAEKDRVPLTTLAVQGDYITLTYQRAFSVLQHQPEAVHNIPKSGDFENKNYIGRSPDLAPDPFLPIQI